MKKPRGSELKLNLLQQILKASGNEVWKPLFAGSNLAVPTI
jgi:hypothetical protein